MLNLQLQKDFNTHTVRTAIWMAAHMCRHINFDTSQKVPGSLYPAWLCFQTAHKLSTSWNRLLLALTLWLCKWRGIIGMPLTMLLKVSLILIKNRSSPSFSGPYWFRRDAFALLMVLAWSLLSANVISRESRLHLPHCHEPLDDAW